MTDMSPPVLSEAEFRLLPDGADVALLIGVIMSPPPGQEGVWLHDSTTTHREFGEDSRDYLIRLSRLTSADEALEIIKSMGGNDEDFARMLEVGLFRLIPGSFTLDDFLGVFSDLGLVTLTAGAATLITDDSVDLYVPERPEETLSVSRVLYELIIRSDGTKALPDVVRNVCGEDREVILYLTEELVTIFGSLLECSLISVVRVK